MAVARGGGGGGGLSPPLWAGRSTLGDKFVRIISILRLEYTTFFKIFRGAIVANINGSINYNYVITVDLLRLFSHIRSGFIRIFPN